MFPIRNTPDARYYQRKREKRYANSDKGFHELQEAIAVYKAAAGDQPYMVPDPKFCITTSNGWLLGNRENGYIASYVKRILFRSQGHARTYQRYHQAIARIDLISVEKIEPAAHTSQRDFLRDFEPDDNGMSGAAAG